MLIGPATASAAEILTLAFRGRAGASSFGAPTRGLSTGNKNFRLRDGAELILTVAATGDRFGNVYLGPIEPEQPVRGAGAGEPRADPVRKAAADWLEGHESCRADPPATSSSGLD